MQTRVYHDGRAARLAGLVVVLGGCGSAGPADGLGAPPYALRVGVFRLAAEGRGGMDVTDGWAEGAAPKALANALAGAPGIVLVGSGAPAVLELHGELRRLPDAWAYDVRATPAGESPADRAVVRGVGPTLREAAIVTAAAVRHRLALPDADWPDSAAPELDRLADLLDQADVREVAPVVAAAARWTAEYPERPHGFLLNARLRRLEGDHIGAREAVDAALVRAPLEPRARVEKARLFLDALRPAEARALLDAAETLSGGAGPPAAAGAPVGADPRAGADPPVGAGAPAAASLGAARLHAEIALLRAVADHTEGRPGPLRAFASDARLELLQPGDRFAMARADFWEVLDAAPGSPGAPPSRDSPSGSEPGGAPVAMTPARDDLLTAAFRGARDIAIAARAGRAVPALAPAPGLDAPALAAARAAGALARNTGVEEALGDMDRTHAGELGPWAAMLVAELRWRIGGEARAGAAGWYARVLEPGYERWRVVAEAERAAARLTSVTTEGSRKP